MRYLWIDRDMALVTGNQRVDMHLGGTRQVAGVLLRGLGVCVQGLIGLGMSLTNASTHRKAVSASNGGDGLELLTQSSEEPAGVLMAGQPGSELVAAEAPEILVLGANGLIHGTTDGTTHGPDGGVTISVAVGLVDTTEVIAVEHDVDTTG